MLSDAKLRALKPKAALYRVADMGGLCIEVRPTGAKKWRYRYRFAGKANMLDLGDYPVVSLQDARKDRDRQKTLLDAGIDPSMARRQAQLLSTVASDNSFAAVAREWMDLRADWSDSTRDKSVWIFENYAFPWIGKRAVGSLTPPEVLALVRRPEGLGKHDTAIRLKQRIGQVVRYAISTGRAERDPTGDLRGALKVTKPQHRAAITDRKQVGELLRAIKGYQGHFTTAIALQLAPLVFVRPGELRHAEWKEIDWEHAEWRIPAGRMKMKTPHIVPLSRQALALLDELQPVTGSGKLIFPSVRSRTRPMSENTVNAALRRLGYAKEEMTGHGFRSTASTILNEMGWNRDWIERQLAHQERDGVRAAYNYAEWLPERAKMMQAWADMVDALRDGGKVMKLRAIA